MTDTATQHAERGGSTMPRSWRDMYGDKRSTVHMRAVAAAAGGGCSSTAADVAAAGGACAADSLPTLQAVPTVHRNVSSTHCGTCTCGVAIYAQSVVRGEHGWEGVGALCPLYLAWCHSW